MRNAIEQKRDRVAVYTRRANVPLTEAEHARLKVVAQRLGVSMSAVVRLAVRKWLADHEGEEF